MARTKKSLDPIRRLPFTAIDPTSAFQQAAACYGRQEWKLAEKLCRRILSSAPRHFDTLHLLASMSLQSQRFGEASELLRQALEIQPNHPAVLTKLGIASTHLKDSEAALSYFEESLRLAPGSVEVFASRGALLESMGRLDAAARDYRKAVAINPNFILGHLLLGNCLAACGLLPDALASYDFALSVVPAFPDALHARGNVLREMQRPLEAMASYESALGCAPDHFAALSSLADLQVQQGLLPAALVNLNRTIQLRPNHESALLIRGSVRYELGDLVGAEKDFASVVRLNPKNPEAYQRIGNIHFGQHRFTLALANFEHALKLDPGNALAYLSAGRAMRALGNLDRATEFCIAALNVDPDDVEAHTSLGSIRLALGQLPLAVQSFRRACELKPDAVVAHSSLLLALTFLPDEVISSALLEEARRWNDLHAVPLEARRFEHRRQCSTPRRMRVGYVSSDLRQHAVAGFMAPILQHHDRQTFEVYCYHCHPGQDDTTVALRARVEHWVEAGSLSEDALAERIHADGIDLLIDLAGHSGGNRLLSFARKPAPVQITYLGFPGTTGMSAMDYRITDALADEPNAQQHYAETLLRLPHSLWCYEVPRNMPDVGGLPASTTGYLTLGSFNNFNKVDASSVRLWARLLLAVPDARLVIATVPEGSIRHTLLADLASFGIDLARIELLPWLPPVDFWRHLERMDISLDPVHVNGATTTCESLWLGVPVVSCVGSRFLERAGLSILTTAGLPEFACESDDACVQLVKDLASDLSRLAALRVGMRERLLRTPLFDGAAFTRSLEDLYREGWRRWVLTAQDAVAP